jgi:hypothetical protein
MKSLFATKTFWVNFLSIVITLLEGKEILDIIPDMYEVYVVALVFAFNVFLRTITSQPTKPLLGGGEGQ